MGTFLHSLAIPKAGAEEVRGLVCRWLAAKGFQRRHDLPLFPCEEDGERGLFLFSNEHWVVVHYSHFLDEGERLLFELSKLNKPILRTWVHDSDLWGYDLFQDGDVTATFNSHPNYFGSVADAASLRTGNPELVCEACGVAGAVEMVARLQRERALFKEEICRHFCAALGVPPAGLDYRDIEGCDVAARGPVRVGDFQMESLFFVDPYRAGQEPAPSLHALEFHSESESQEIPAELEAYFRAWQRWARAVAIIMRPLFFVFRIFLRLNHVWPQASPLYRRWFGSLGPLPSESFYRDLFELSWQSCRMDGRRLINDRHHSAIKLPEQAVALLDPLLNLVFQFDVEDASVICEAFRPASIRHRFRLPMQTTVVQDEKFFVGQLPARAITLRQVFPTQPEEIVRLQYLYYVQTGQAIYAFSGSAADGHELDAGTLQQLRDAVASFEIIESRA
jgi:hypothetical protein